MFGIMFDYRRRSRALQQLINQIERQRHAKRQEFFKKSNRERVRDDHFQLQFFKQYDADEQLLECLQALWSFPGLSRQVPSKRLKPKAFVNAAGRLLVYLDHQHARALRMADRELADAYWLTAEFLIVETNRYAWEHGLPYDPSYFQSDEPEQTSRDNDNVGLDILEPSVTLVSSTAMFDGDELDVPEFLRDDFQPSGA